jgi:hypothetical protein
MLDLFQILIAILAKIKDWIMQLLAFLTKEFFLLFVYLILGSLWGAIAWYLFSHALPNKALYSELVRELYHSERLAFLFFVVLGISGQYVYRLLHSSAQSILSK